MKHLNITVQEWTCLPSIRRGLFKNSIIPTIYSCLSLFVARSPLPPLFPRLLSATSVIIVRTHAARTRGYDYLLIQTKNVITMHTTYVTVWRRGKKDLKFWSSIQPLGTNGLSAPPHDMNTHQEDKIPNLHLCDFFQEDYPFSLSRCFLNQAENQMKTLSCYCVHVVVGPT